MNKVKRWMLLNAVGTFVAGGCAATAARTHAVKLTGEMSSYGDYGSGQDSVTGACANDVRTETWS